MQKIPKGTKTILLNGLPVGEYEATGDFKADAEAVLQVLKDKGLHKETSAFQAAFNQALSFATASQYLYEKDLRNTPRKGAVPVPFVVNATFSIELYLKALSLKHGVALHGHELIKLYDRLPANAKADIEEMANKFAPDSDLVMADHFTEYLRELNNTFVEWRYSFEKEFTGPVHIDPTIFVMRVLHEACRVEAR